LLLALFAVSVTLEASLMLRVVAGCRKFNGLLFVGESNLQKATLQIEFEKPRQGSGS